MSALAKAREPYVSLSQLRSIVTDEDIQRSAAGMMSAYPAHAADECQIKIQKFAARGDRFGAQVWTRILLAIRKIERPPTSQVQTGARAEYGDPAIFAYDTEPRNPSNSGNQNPPT